MEQVNILLVDKFVVFFLVFVRMTSLFVVAPVFGRQNTPTYLKIGLAFFCSLIIIPLLGELSVDYNNVFSYTALVAKEFAVGIILGYISFLVFSALYTAGQIIDIQIGFGMVNLLDPINDIQVPLTSNFLYILTTILFLMMNGHHILLSAVYKSFSILPIGGFAFSEALMQNVVSIFCDIFIIGFKISAPVLAACLLAEMGLGILARTVPQMNVFVIGMPLKIVVGLFTLLFMMPVFVKVLNITFDKMYSYIYIILQNMTKG